MRCSGGDVEASPHKRGDDLGHPRLLGSNMSMLGGDEGSLHHNVLILGRHLLLEFHYLLRQ